MADINSLVFVEPTTAIVLGAINTAVLLLLSHGAFIAWAKRTLHSKNGYTPLRKLYEDLDGKTTEEAQLQYRKDVRYPATIALASSILGLGAAIAATVLQAQDPHACVIVDACLRLANWLLLCLQALHVITEQRPVVRFRSAYLALLSRVTILAELAAVCLVCVQWQMPHNDTNRLLIAILATQAALALISGLSLGLIPRRPMVYAKDGKPVDAEFTVSILAGLVFSWAVPLLGYARKHKSLTLGEIPVLADYIRAETLQRTYNEEKKDGRRLWLQLVVYLRGGFTKQMIMISTVSITQFFPQFAMFNLLELLEARPAGGAVTSTVWLWVLALFLAMIVSSWIEAFLFWSAMGQVAVPARNLLSALIFLKSTRRKDVKGVSGPKIAVEEINGNGKSTSLTANGKSSKKEDPKAEAEANQKTSEDDELERMQKSRQNTINLVGVDTNRVYQFCTSSYIFPGSVVKLLVSFTFLFKLVGGWPVIAGLLAFGVSLPLNVLFSRNYTTLQGAVMKLRDAKLAVLTEALQGIRQIKFSALEQEWEEKIGERRQKELATLWQAFLWDTGLFAVWTFGPVMLAAAVLTTYALIHGSLEPSVAFTTVAVLNAIEVTLAVVPELTSNALDAWVSLTRIEDYLDSPEKTDCLTRSDSIALRNASVAWPADSQDEDPDRFLLRDISLEFPRKELSVITGKTGSGKSLLLAALLGEVDKLAGSIEMPLALPSAERFDVKATKDNWIIDSSVAFVAQIPWIENATIKANITWGLPLDEERYSTVIEVCALTKDLEMLEDGDMTDIGANGINLSGGQRWRISFARALYSRAGILILDDIFSAVDAHVGKQLFEEALTGSLGTGRTRILVTHHVGLVISKTKYTVKIEDGRVVHVGDVEELEQTGGIVDIMKDDAASKNIEEEEIKEVLELADEDPDPKTLRLISSRRRSSAAALIDGSAGAVTKGKSPKKFNETEGRELGRIKTQIYTTYIKMSGGAKTWLPLMVVFLLNMALPIMRSYTITQWTRSYETESSHNTKSTAFPVNTFGGLSNHQLPISFRTAAPSQDQETPTNPEIWTYLGIYLILSFFSVIFGSLKFFMTYLASILASRKMFEEMIFVVLRAPLRWLDTVPVGRVLNRFSADFNQVDSSIALTFALVVSRLLDTMGITVTAVFVSPLMLPVAFVLFGVVLFIALYYLSGAREVKRLESISKSPIFEQFGSVLAGIGTIRAFDKADEYTMRMYAKCDGFATANWHTALFNRWMALELNFVGAIFAFIVAAVVVSAKIDAALAGFALSFSLQYTSAIISLLRNYAQLEMILNAAERIIEYVRLPTENLGGTKPPAAWPAQGRLEVSGLVAGYAPDLPPVLKGLTFTVEPHQRVGVIGRTGAGKSTLSLALWRFIHVREGTVHVDGIDTSDMTLHDLRSRLAIIPQDPVLFSGTVRSNMDPFNEHSDDELRDALERVHLTSGTSPSSRDSLISAIGNSSGTHTPALETNTNIFNSLSSPISEGGLSLSQGQRQLLCLARTIVRKPKIMLLDEATSAVDMATDAQIQRSIREEFRDSTLLVIAHRLSTIADFDRILVMSEGMAVEYDSPKVLWEQKGTFYGMCCSSGEKDLLEKIINDER